MKISLRILIIAICLMAGATSCSMLDRHKLDDKNMDEITFVWDVTASDIAWASAAERKQEILNLVNIKKIDRALPELIERAEAGIEIEVELADGTDAATITYPNIATFNAAARGEATDVNE